ncbi:hypothetical protein FZZ93_17870 [Halomonas eurihalina]|uniref:Uncharacterized protein n=1 Tax=Halomonas eurihalina TaxID=42566 RepID=A0A5D9CH36_HALER|nr:protealysin inhibitor emfourin [Halomonas eurihalina]MDR5861311.1 hypothetical protein [Halomonas eurihalina]TZG31004.1 hypothetical protein FZZ93_17870 [Halomonas eurihalina]
MNAKDAAPRLTATSVLRLSREGGVAHMPGLARPRRIRCDRCSEAQRAELQALLDEAVRYGECQAPGADRRILHLGVEEGGETPTWTLSVSEDSVPDTLLRWWRLAVEDSFSSDDGNPA